MKNNYDELDSKVPLVSILLNCYNASSFISKAIESVLCDLSGKEPMDRLLCGDVGFGKTEDALRAIVRVVSFSKQVAL